MASKPIKAPLSKPPKGGFVYQPPEYFPADLVPHGDYKAAWADMIDHKMCASRKYQEQQWRALRIGAHPQLLQHMRFTIAKFKSMGIPVYAHTIVRSRAQQQKEFDEGDSKARPDKAPHVWGAAYDLIHSVYGWGLSKKQWEFMGHVGKQLAISRSIPITWGGDWPPIVEKVGWDPAHWQLRNWRATMSEFPHMPEMQIGKINGASG